MKKISFMIAGFVFLSIIFIGNSVLIAEEPKLSSLEKLGQKLYNDKNLSDDGNQSCQTCHHPAAKFADPENTQDPVEFPVSDGSNPDLFGGRNAPSAAYTKFSPKLQWDDGLFIGGMFWDGRATGNAVTDTDFSADWPGAGPTGDPLADQAKGPFLNPVEMANGNVEVGVEVVVNKVLASNYAEQFLAEFGSDPYTNIGEAYNFIAIAIAEFEKSHKLNKFSSRFDGFLAEQGDVSSFGVEVEEVDGVVIRRYVGPPEGFNSQYLSYDEADGLAIFNADSYQQSEVNNEDNVPNGGMCYLCHLTEAHDADTAPVFTDFSYDNLGVPVNDKIADLPGMDPQPIDYGLGGIPNILAGVPESPYSDPDPVEPVDYPKYRSEDIPACIASCEGDTDCIDDCKSSVSVYEDEIGKFKEPTLRNIAKTAPYFHNGVFATLEQVVTFYNKRDELQVNGEIGPPEVVENVNDGELGNLGLTDDQERKLVLFMRTLTDE